MAIGVLQWFAAGAPVGVFVAIGQDASERVENLSLDPRLRFVASPRHASVLLVAGAVRRSDLQALRVVHDQLPPPRATLWWGAEPFDEMAAPTRLPLSGDALPQVLMLGARLSRSPNSSEPDLLADEPPNPWRGVGPNGQGGKGMMGGVPYGRPMAMTAEDGRDGLTLDETTVQLGPYLQDWPPGLVLELVLQGDVVQRARVVRPPLAPTQGRGREQADLRCAARVLKLLQLDALAERCRRAARAREQGDGIDLAALAGVIRRAGAFAALPPGLGTCMVAGADTDVRSRLKSWLGVAGPALPAASTDPQARLADLLAGLEWNEAMLVVNSFSPGQLCTIAPHDSTVDDAAGHPKPEPDMAAMEHRH